MSGEGGWSRDLEVLLSVPYDFLTWTGDEGNGIASGSATTKTKSNDDDDDSAKNDLGTNEFEVEEDGSKV